MEGGGEGWRLWRGVGMEERRKSWRHQAPHEARKDAGGPRSHWRQSRKQQLAHMLPQQIFGIQTRTFFFFQERIGDLKDNVFSCLNIYSSARTYFYHIGELTK